jgi:catechol 2,3-dioxygenase-like lactoylglutathione lyase family enzyme
MLDTKEPRATVAVRDLAAARKFYEGTVGLKPPRNADPRMVNYRCGNAWLFVYESENAGTNHATAVTWIVGDDLAETVRALAANGVAFRTVRYPRRAQGRRRLRVRSNQDGMVQGSRRQHPRTGQRLNRRAPAACRKIIVQIDAVRASLCRRSIRRHNGDPHAIHPDGLCERGRLA